MDDRSQEVVGRLTEALARLNKDARTGQDDEQRVAHLPAVIEALKARAKNDRSRGPGVPPDDWLLFVWAGRGLAQVAGLLNTVRYKRAVSDLAYFFLDRAAMEWAKASPSTPSSRGALEDSSKSKHAFDFGFVNATNVDR